MALNFKKKFEGRGLARVAELTSDTDMSTGPFEGGIVCCTPEKYDACSRNWIDRVHGQTKLVRSFLFYVRKNTQ